MFRNSLCLVFGVGIVVIATGNGFAQTTASSLFSTDLNSPSIDWSANWSSGEFFNKHQPNSSLNDFDFESYISIDPMLHNQSVEPAGLGQVWTEFTEFFASATKWLFTNKRFLLVLAVVFVLNWLSHKISKR